MLMLLGGMWLSEGVVVVVYGFTFRSDPTDRFFQYRYIFLLSPLILFITTSLPFPPPTAAVTLFILLIKFIFDHLFKLIERYPIIAINFNHLPYNISHHLSIYLFHYHLQLFDIDCIRLEIVEMMERLEG